MHAVFIFILMKFLFFRRSFKMWNICFSFLNGIAYIIGWLVIIIVSIRVAVGPTQFQELRNCLYANLVAFVLKDRLKEALKTTKTDLFSSMTTLKSVDPQLSKRNALLILEVSSI